MNKNYLYFMFSFCSTYINFELQQKYNNIIKENKEYIVNENNQDIVKFISLSMPLSKKGSFSQRLLIVYDIYKYYIFNKILIYIFLISLMMYAKKIIKPLISKDSIEYEDNIKKIELANEKMKKVSFFIFICIVLNTYMIGLFEKKKIMTFILKQNVLKLLSLKQSYIDLKKDKFITKALTDSNVIFSSIYDLIKLAKNLLTFLQIIYFLFLSNILFSTFQEFTENEASWDFKMSVLYSILIIRKEKKIILPNNKKKHGFLRYIILITIGLYIYLLGDKIIKKNIGSVNFSLFLRNKIFSQFYDFFMFNHFYRLLNLSKLKNKMNLTIDNIIKEEYKIYLAKCLWIWVYCILIYISVNIFLKSKGYSTKNGFLSLYFFLNIFNFSLYFLEGEYFNIKKVKIKEFHILSTIVSSLKDCISHLLVISFFLLVSMSFAEEKKKEEIFQFIIKMYKNERSKLFFLIVKCFISVPITMKYMEVIWNIFYCISIKIMQIFKNNQNNKNYQGSKYYYFDNSDTFEDKRDDLSVKHLSYIYPNTSSSEEVILALNDININIPAGDKIIITGENGSGKSTFLENLMTNIIGNKKGDIFLGNQNINEIDYFKLLKKIKFICACEFPATELRQLLYLLCGEDLSDEILYKIIEEVGLNRRLPKEENCLDNFVSSNYLSEGEKKRLLLCAIMAIPYLKHKPSIIIFDEVFREISYDMISGNKTGSKVIGRIELEEKISKVLQNNNITVISVEHISDERFERKKTNFTKKIYFKKGKILKEEIISSSNNTNSNN